MSKKYKFLSHSVVVLFLLIISADSFAQAKKTNTPPAKGAPVKGAKGPVAAAKGTLAADMDCTVKLNGGTKLISLKAYTPLEVVLKAGDNSVEATSTDKKASFHNSVTGKPGETVVVEISFFDDSKFLDYIKEGNVNMAETAIKKNPNLATNADGTLITSPLQIAIENSQPEMVNFLLSKGASFLKPENIYPLHLAIKYASSVKPAKDKPAPDKQLMDLFISKGCKITDKDDGGNTPLHCAVRAGKMDIVTSLVKMGADVNAKNDFDETPLKIAEDKGEISIISFLASNGAKEK
ncbi:MAG: ankyrin repeat domain-containing protein [Bacteroidia bacterium]